MKFREMREMYKSIVQPVLMFGATREYIEKLMEFEKKLKGRYSWMDMSDPQFLERNVPPDLLVEFNEIYRETLDL